MSRKIARIFLSLFSTLRVSVLRFGKFPIKIVSQEHACHLLISLGMQYGEKCRRKRGNMAVFNIFTGIGEVVYYIFQKGRASCLHTKQQKN